MDQLESRITATLAYAGLFGAGLTEPELAQRMFGPGPVRPDDLSRQLHDLNAQAGILRRRGDRYFSMDAVLPAGEVISPDMAPIRSWAHKKASPFQDDPYAKPVMGNRSDG